MTEQVTQDETKGLPPGVSGADVPEDQHTTQDDPGIPKPIDVSNKAPEVKTEAAEDTKQEEAPEKPETESKTETETDQSEYVEYGHSAADAAVALLKEQDIPPEEAAGWFNKVVETGDINQMDVAAIEARLGKTQAALVITAVKDYYTGALASTQQIVDTVYKEVGSKENLDAIVKWALDQETKSPDFGNKMNDLRKMFELGSNSAALAARELRALYEAAPGNSGLEVSKVSGDSTGHTTHGESLSRKDYLAQMKDANDKGDQAEMSRLRALRLQSLGK